MSLIELYVLGQHTIELHVEKKNQAGISVNFEVIIIVLCSKVFIILSN